jgi:O-antigen/teichoic acid export membrane protein
MRLITLAQGLLNVNTLGIVWVQLLLPLANFFSIVLVARILDTHSTNIFMLLYVTAWFAAGFSDFGLRNTVYIESSKKSDDALLDYIGSIYSLRIVMGFIVVVGFTIYCYVVTRQPLLICVVFGFISGNMYSADPGVQILRGRLLAKYEIAYSTIERGGLVAILITMKFFHLSGFLWVVIAFLFVSIVRLVLVYLTIRARIGRFRLSLVRRSWVKILKINLHVGMILLLFILLRKFPVILSPYLGLNEDIAVVAIILQVLQSAEFFPAVIAFAVIPSMFHGNSSSWGRAENSRNILLVNVLGGIVATAFLSIFCRPILSLFGPEYARGVHLLFVSSFVLPFMFVNQTIRHLAIAHNYVMVLLFCVLIGCLSEISILIVAVDNIGLNGAVLGFAIAEFILCALLIIVFYERLMR